MLKFCIPQFYSSVKWAKNGICLIGFYENEVIYWIELLEDHIESVWSMVMIQEVSV